MKWLTAAIIIASLLSHAGVEPNRQANDHLRPRRLHGRRPRKASCYDGAKREGKLVWYTTLATDQNKQIAAAFEKKYPGVSVDTYRTGSSALTQRLLTEAKARRHIADAVETTPGGMMTFRESQFLLPYTSPYLAAFPEDAKERAKNAGLLDHRARILRRLCLQQEIHATPPTCRKTSKAY